MSQSPSVRAFGLIGGVEAIVRGTTLSVYPLTLYRAWGDAVVVSQIYLAVGIISLLTVLSVPWMNRHLARRYVHTLGIGLYCVAAILGAMGGKLVAIALLCSAVGTAIAFVCYNANVLDHIAKEEFGRLETVRLFSAGIGWSVGPFLGVWLLQFWAPAPFVIVGIAALVMLVCVWTMKMGSTQRHSAFAAASPNPFTYLPRFVAQPRLVAGWFLAVMRSCGWGIYLVYVGIFAIENGLSDRVGGIAASLASMGLFLTPLMLRWVHGRSLRNAVRLGFFCAGACFMLAAAFSPFPWVSVAILMLGAYFLVLLDVCGGLPFLMSVKPSERSAMSAVYSTFRDVANILTPAAVWAVLHFTSVAGVFAVGGLALLAAWYVAGYIHPQLGIPGASRVRAVAAAGR